MAALGVVLKALLQAVLEFLGQRLDRRDADGALRELGARDAEAGQHEEEARVRRAAAALRTRPAGGDDELDRRLRAPADRDQGRSA